jgi:hypothetical protein
MPKQNIIHNPAARPVELEKEIWFKKKKISKWDLFKFCSLIAHEI